MKKKRILPPFKFKSLRKRRGDDLWVAKTRQKEKEEEVMMVARWSRKRMTGTVTWSLQ